MPWSLPKSEDELLQLAKRYPYDTPGLSYLFSSEAVRPLDVADPKLFEGRTAVLAHGSNRSPQQLRRKFANWSADESLMPVTRAWLQDYDVVYSAHITQYGAIATNLHHAEGHRIELFINWLTDKQLSYMHMTELPNENYSYGRMQGIALEVEKGPRTCLGEVMVYLSTRGCFSPDGEPVAAAGLPGEGRAHRPLHQEEMLLRVRDLFRPGRDLDLHILETIRDAALRANLVGRMKAHALPPKAPHFEALDV